MIVEKTNKNTINKEHKSDLNEVRTEKIDDNYKENKNNAKCSIKEGTLTKGKCNVCSKNADKQCSRCKNI
jgi:hypothetical protein